MFCLTPEIDRNITLTPPFDMEIAFVMDNIYFIPENNLLSVGLDPIYYPFEDETQELNTTAILDFQVISTLLFLIEFQRSLVNSSISCAICFYSRDRIYR